MIERLRRSADRAKARSDLIDRMTSRFLAWKLPENFSPDAGISFKAEFNEHTGYPMRHEPSGTNLFSYTQAREMVRAMLGDDTPAPDDNKAGGLWYRRWHTQAAEIARLRGLVEAAYKEGFGDGWGGGNKTRSETWEASDTRKALEQKP